MKPHPLAKKCLAKLVRFGQIWLDLGEIWLDLGKICANLGISDFDLGKLD